MKGMSTTVVTVVHAAGCEALVVMVTCRLPVPLALATGGPNVADPEVAGLLKPGRASVQDRGSN